MLKKFCFTKNVRRMFSTTDYDVCVVGGGPAGILLVIKVILLLLKLDRKV